MKGKKFLAVFLSIAMVLTMIPIMSISASENTQSSEVSYNSDVDYSDANNWLTKEDNPTKSADVFYVYPTIVMEGTVVDIDDETMRTGATYDYSAQAGILSDDFNCYAPFYRQLAMSYELTSTNVDELVALLKNNVTMDDIYASLDYYFTNINKNAERPFILAGHSQGSAILRVVLEDYMKNHPQYYNQMIATYALGMGFGSEWQSKNTHVKTATGADDTGVLIAWNTEGPSATTSNLLLDTDTYVINPLNWKTDATYAGKEKNLGSLQSAMDRSTYVTPGENDAQIDLTRHSLICTTKTTYMDVPIFGDKCLHGGDWGYYLENIRENAVNRRDKFLEKSAVDYSDANNWLAKESNPTKSADVFYIYPTVTTEGTVADIDSQEMRSGATKIYNTQAGILSDEFNVYAPFYRQLAMNYIMTPSTISEVTDLLKANVTIDDIYAALDYYFTNINKNAERPFIIAAHSQGSAVTRVILEDYMKTHTEYYKQMIAAYAIGMGFGSEWLSKNTHVIPATSADDTGVLITWNTEGADATLKNTFIDNDSCVINPLTWTVDGTYAGKEKNLGSLQNSFDISTLVTPGENDAQIDLSRHSLICKTSDNYAEGVDYFFGDKSLHFNDWGLYLMNIKENAINRRNKFMQEDKSGWQQNSSGQWQYFENGTAVTGWKNNIPGWNGQWFYFDANGIMATGWKNDIPGWNGTWFYFNSNGTMKTGWANDISGWAGTWFYFNTNGSMQIGWLASGDKWYYFNTNGTMVTGWKTDIPNYAGKWFYFEPSSNNSICKMGEMYQNTFCTIGDDKKIYGFEANGVMKANAWSRDTYKANDEVKIWVYYGADGARVTGWNLIDGKWYCFGYNGEMYAGCTTPDGYRVDDNGVWVK